MADIKRDDRQAVAEAVYNVTAIAKVISLSYGEDPDEDAPLSRICGSLNEPLPCWMAYEEQAKAVFVWMFAVTDHLLTESAERERVLREARPLDDWHEDHGFVTWWCWCDGRWLGEPAWIGSPLCSDWPDYHTHWTPHPPLPAALRASEETKP